MTSLKAIDQVIGFKNNNDGNQVFKTLKQSNESVYEDKGLVSRKPWLDKA